MLAGHAQQRHQVGQRAAEIVEEAGVRRKDLFPDISIGDAPVAGGA